MSHTTPFISFLQRIADTEPGTIRAAVAEEALGHDDPYLFFQDLGRHGCISGMVDCLIYSADTHAFFDRHYDEINEMRADYGAEIGRFLGTAGDLKNDLAWFAFEETAVRLFEEFSPDDDFTDRSCADGRIPTLWKPQPETVNDRTRRIAEMNDLLRQSLFGTAVLTVGVRSLDEPLREQALTAVREFTDFTPA